jgi:hypothetical protein
VSTDAVSAGEDHRLPSGFEDLEPFVCWSLRTETERIKQRQNSTFAQIVTFRDAVLPQLERIFAHLGEKPLETLTPPDERLLLLTLSLAEVAPAVEFYGQPGVIDGFDALRFLPVESSRLRPKI